MSNRKPTFYLYWSIGFLLITAIAFAPRYWLVLLKEGVEISSAIHWHAFFTSIWIIIYAVQSFLINKRSIRLHQTLGYASILITIGVIISGFFVSTGLVERALASNSAGAKPLLLVNILDLAMFAALYAFAIKNRRAPLTHKRLMTLSAIVLLNPGLFRIGRFIIGPGFPAVLFAIVLTSSVIVLYLWREKKHSQQSNKKLWKIAIAVMVIHVIRIPLALTPVWANITDIIMDSVR